MHLAKCIYWCSPSDYGTFAALEHTHTVGSLINLICSVQRWQMPQEHTLVSGSHTQSVQGAQHSVTVLLLWVAKWLCDLLVFSISSLFCRDSFECWRKCLETWECALDKCCMKCSVQVSCSMQTCKCFCWLSSRRIQQFSYSWELYPLCFPLSLEEGVIFTTIQWV